MFSNEHGGVYVAAVPGERASHILLDYRVGLPGCPQVQAEKQARTPGRSIYLRRDEICNEQFATDSPL